MAYSSFVRTELKEGKYDILQALLNPARYGPADAYLLQVRNVGDICLPQDSRIRGAIEMERSVDIVVYAALEEVKEIARDVCRKVLQPVGIANYRKEDRSIETHTQAGIARDIAEEEGEELHVYNPAKDSLEVTLKG
jgi:hypothetical protein